MRPHSIGPTIWKTKQQEESKRWIGIDPVYSCADIGDPDFVPEHIELRRPYASFRSARACGVRLLRCLHTLLNSKR
jgi:hypothetical protein